MDDSTRSKQMKEPMVPSEDQEQHVQYTEFDEEPELRKKKSYSSVPVALYAAIACLGVFLILALFTIIGLAIVLDRGTSKGAEVDIEMDDTCMTQECVELSALVLGGLNESVDPCDNMYEFACGNWIESNSIDPALVYSTFGLLNTRNRIGMKRALLSMQGRELRSTQKVQDFFQSCINVENSNALGVGPLVDLLAETGGWDLVNIPGDGSVWSLGGEQFLQEKLRGSPAFFKVISSQDSITPTRYIITVVSSGLTLPPTSYNDENVLSNASSLIVQVLQTINPVTDTTVYNSAASQILSVEKALANIHLDKPLQYQRMSLAEAQANWQWTDYNVAERIPTLFARAGVTDVGPNEPLQIQSPMYFEHIAGVLSQFSNSDLQNYAKWQIVFKSLLYLDSNCVASFLAFKQLGNPTQSLTIARSDQCVGITESNMPLALARVFADYVLPNPSEAVRIGAEMTTALMNAFRERIDTLDWLDEETIKRAEKKIDFMGQSIAYPDVIVNDAELNAVYEGYEISPTDLFANYHQFLVNGVRDNLAQLRLKPDLWRTAPASAYPTTTTAFYHLLQNHMYISEGIMDVPFFSTEWPVFFRYGTLGTVIGHEITHGFDSSGRLYNETGQDEMWWTEQSVQNFIERQQCFVDQYSAFSEFGINMNGVNTLAENIADAGGVSAGYEALKDSKEPSQKLPGLKYSVEQLYFIAFSQLWCIQANTPALWQLLMQTDPTHSPGIYRVIGTLQNNAAFSEAFGCRSGSPMNPVSKCSLW